MPQNQLPPDAAELIRKRIVEYDQDREDSLTSLLGKNNTQEERQEAIFNSSMMWARCVFSSILEAWARIGISPEDFEEIAKNEVERVAAHAEVGAWWAFGRIVVRGNRVLEAAREELPQHISRYREDNRFLFEALNAVPTNSSEPGTVEASGDETPLQARKRQAFIARFLVKETLSGIATRSDVAHSSLHRWRGGECRLHPDNRKKLADYLGVEPGDIPNE